MSVGNSNPEFQERSPDPAAPPSRRLKDSDDSNRTDDNNQTSIVRVGHVVEVLQPAPVPGLAHGLAVLLQSGRVQSPRRSSC